jgi:hypothetical protein
MNAVKVIAVAALFIALGKPPLGAQTNPSFPRFPMYPSSGAPRPGASPATAWNTRHRINLKLPTFHLATNCVVAAVEIGEEVPDQIALVVKRLGSSVTNAPAPVASSQSAPNVPRNAAFADARARIQAMRSRMLGEQVDWQDATWVPFTTNLPIDLGPGDGERLLWIGARWRSADLISANGTHVYVDHAPPVVTVTNPTETVTSRPVIQLQGYTDEPVQSIRYDVFNASNQVTDVQGFVASQYFDPETRSITTNYFECLDIELGQGTNTIVLRCTDLAGNTSTNTLTYLFTFDQDKTPPMISLDRPVNGREISGDTFTVRGRLDDPTARLTALIRASSGTNLVEGLVERNGYFWVEDIPLHAGATYLTVTATDGAGNSSQTNLVVYKSNEILTIDSIPEDQLWRATITVTGKVSPPNQAVWVNGVQAKVKADGAWVAERVPVLSPNGGTAVFEATTVPPSGEPAHAPGTNQPAPVVTPRQLVSVSAGLGTNAAVLNPRQASCGGFNLHLMGAAGRSFVLYTSTNLNDWTPILTNVSSRDTFDFTDTEPATNQCRFFRVLPLP